MVPGSEESLTASREATEMDARDTDLALMATVEAYIDRITQEAADSEEVSRRLNAIEAQIQAVIDLATVSR